MKEVCGQKIRLKYFWKECLSKLTAPSQSEIYVYYEGRVGNGPGLTPDQFFLYEYEI